MNSPFKFLDAYTLSDRDAFFGRDEEIDALYQLVFKTPLLLVYGLSGTGKTSLVQCGLAGRFDGPDWLPLFIRRQNDLNDSLRAALTHALNGQWRGELVETAAYLYKYYLRPVYLIFDQFEELLILGASEEQERFMRGIQQLLDAQLPCKILLVMREEYLGRLYAFERFVPSIFDFRLRVEPMSAGKVREVLRASFQRFNIQLEAPEEARLTQIIDNISAGKSGIQLPYLQVYLDMLYREDYRRVYGESLPEVEWPSLTFTAAEIEAFGRIDEVLEKFLQEQARRLQTLLEQEHSNISDDAVERLLDAFVTEEGTKRPAIYQRDAEGGIVLEGVAASLLADLPSAALTAGLSALEQRRLLRFTDDSIELAHDALAALIDQRRSDEQRRINEILRRLKNSLAEHKATGEYLTRRQLNALEEFLPRLHLDAEAQAFVDNSRAHLERQEAAEAERQRRELELARQKLAAEQSAARRQRRLSAIIGAAALLAIGLGVWAFQQRNAAEAAGRRLRQEIIQNYLNSAENLKSQGQYLEALAPLEVALGFIENAEWAARVDTVLGQWRRLAEHMSAADSLSQSEENLLAALEQYRKAYAIAPDRLIATKIGQTEVEIDRLFEDYLQRGVSIMTYDGCRFAKPLFEKALALKPSEPSALRLLKNCL
jgi:hypothetical protein